MSSEDQVRPFHAKGEARGQETADAVAAVLKHAQEREKAVKDSERRRKQPRWMLPLGIQLSVLAAYLLIAPPAFVTLDPIPPPDPATQVEQLRVAMWMQIQRVESYRIQHGVLPEKLSDAGSAVPSVEYRREGSTYQLIGTTGAGALTYHSTESAADFVGPAADRLSLRGGG